MAPPSTVSDTAARTSWRPLVAACVGTFLLLIYTTIVTVAAPTIRSDLGGGFTEMHWIVDVFTVALAGLMLGMGSLSDNLGRKRVYLAGLVLFGVSTVACGLAGSAGVLIAARAAQGVAGAAMFATILPLIGLPYRGAARAQAFAIWGTVAGAAGAIGTVAGGTLAEFLGWRWIFLATLPIWVVALVLACTSLQETPRTRQQMDPAGIVSFTIAATAVTYAVISGGDRGWTASETVIGLAIAVLAVLTFVVVEGVTQNPMVPPQLFGTRAFVGVLVISFGYYPSAFGALPIMALWLQETTGLGGTGTSLVLAFQVVVFLLVSGLISKPLHRMPPGRVLGAATVLIGLGCCAVVAVTLGASWLALMPLLLITGFGAGIVSPIFPAVAIASVPDAYAGTAGAAANCARQLGLAIGVALCGTVYTGHAGQAGNTAGTTGLITALLSCAVLAFVSGLLGWWLLSSRPSYLTARASASEAV